MADLPVSRKLAVRVIDDPFDEQPIILFRLDFLSKLLPEDLKGASVAK